MPADAKRSWWAAEPVEVLDSTVADILLDAASRAPDAVGLVDGGAEDPSARRRWTYRAMAREATEVAMSLAGAFEPGSRLAVCGPSLPESLLLSYAAAMARLVLVPVNPALRPPELLHVLGRSGAQCVFHAEHWRGQDIGSCLADLRGELPELREVVDFATWDEWRSDLSAGSLGALYREGPSPDDVAQIVYTSGTTGAPKGAMLTHRGMTNAARLAAKRFGMRAGDVYLQTMPLFHVGGQVVCFQICQHLANAVLMPFFEPGAALARIEEEHATLTCGVPTMLLSMVDHPDFERRDLSSLRAVSSGGAVVPTELVRRVEEALGARFAIVFGQTEASGFVSQTELDDPDEVKAASLGRPLPALEARVVGEDGEVVPIGEVGELEVRGPNVMAGYHDLPEETQAALSPARWLRTGDLVDMDADGVLRIRGRRKDMIVRGGENLYPAEIEAALEAHPSVAESAVVGVPDARWGEVPVAVVRPVPGATPDAGVLEAWLRERLAAFKVPRRWEWVEELPRTASGKVQKFALRERLGADGPSAPDPPVAP